MKIRKAICLVFVSAAIAAACSCSGTDNNAQSPSSKESTSDISDESFAAESSERLQGDENSSGISYTVPFDEKITAVSSSVTSPLKTGEWGTAAKYSTKDDAYFNVPVRVISAVRGEAAAKELEKLKKEHSLYYSELLEDEEYIIAEYEICLDGFPVDKGGNLCDITAFISNTEGEPFMLEGGTYRSFSSFCLDCESYYYEGVIRSKLAYKILKNAGEYLIALGEYGETQAFVKLTDQS